MKKDLEEALNKVEMGYHELVEIANDTINPQFESINMLVDEINSKINNFNYDVISNDCLYNSNRGDGN